MIKWRLIGLALKVYGRAFKRVHILWLGYYLLGSGKRRELPDWAWDKVTGLHRGSFRDALATRGWWTPSAARNYDLFNTVGKFVRRDERLLDRYAFYATCNAAMTHGMECECDDKSWNDVSIDVKLKDLKDYKQWTRLVRKVRVGPVQLRTYLSGRAFRFEIETNDRIFADIGTPFYTTALIPSRLL